MSEAPRPLFPEIGVVALIPDPWDGIWQTRHQVMARLARFFHVVWVNPVVHWRRGLRPRRERDLDLSAPKPASFSVQYPLLPGFHRPRWIADRVFDARIGRARSTLRRRGCSRLAVYLWRPNFARAMSSASFDLSCYHIDDEYSFSRVEQTTPDAEARLIRSVDQVFVHSDALFEKKGHLNPRTMMAPNGVDFASFATPIDEPDDLAPIGHPRVGYTGMVKRQLDWGLLRALVDRHPEWQFVFVGKCSNHDEAKQAVADLSAKPTAHFLGTKPVWEIARYPQHFDVCIMPYRRDDYTKFIYPLKVHEYLAGGKPVVGARIRSLEPLERVVTLAASLDEWSAAITDAIRPESRTPERVAERRAVAQEHDWGRLVERIARTMATTLLGDTTGRLP